MGPFGSRNTSGPCEFSLIAGIVDGSPDAFGALFDAHAQDVFAFCLRRSPDAETAEDLVSVVFLEAWRSRKSAVVVDGSMRPWLLGIATNVAKHAARSRMRYAAALDRYAASQSQLSQGDPADDVVARAAARDANVKLRRALEGLPKREYAVAHLVLVLGMDTASAASVLNISHSATKSALARARRRLRRVLQKGDAATPGGPSGNQSGERRPGAPVGRVRNS
jgi:RNA polymerase sigma factor (sigma-70 family)